MGEAAGDSATTRVARAVAAGASLGEILSLISRESAGLVGGDGGLVWRADTTTISIVGSSSDRVGSIGARFTRDNGGAVASCLRSIEPTLVEYASLHEHDEARIRARELGYAASIAAPVLIGDHAWGALHVLTHRVGALARDSAQALESFAGLAALAIGFAQDRAQLERRATEHEAIIRISTMLAGAASPDEILETVAREVAGLVGLEVGAIGRLGTGVAELLAAWIDPDLEMEIPEALRRVPLEVDTVLSRVARTGEPARVDDYAALDNEVARAVARLPIRSSVAAPIVVEGRLWGAVVGTSPRPHAVPADAEERLTRLGDVLGLAISSAEQRASLEREASTDPLTGLANRRVFGDRLEEELARARRHGRMLALAILDIDHFKRVNDRHGHAVGDAVLREVAIRLTRQARPGDLVARIGGEEFAWILPDTSEISAWHALERIRLAISEQPMVEGISVTASAGVVDTASTSDPDALLGFADAALYRAKASGRNLCIRHSGSGEVTRTPSEPRRDTTLTPLRALAHSVESSDPSARGHSERVADMSVRLATGLGWEIGPTVRLREAALLHDIGRIATPESAGHDGSPVDAAVLGSQILTRALLPDQVAWIRSMGECFDGSGGPDGLIGEAIPEGARILAVAHTFDRLAAGIGHRPRSPADALARCRHQAGRMLCPTVVDVLGRLDASGALS